MVSIPAGGMTPCIFGVGPRDTIFILGLEMEERDDRGWCVTFTTPHAITGGPTPPGTGKVGAEEAVRPLPHVATAPAIPDPFPERGRIHAPAKD